MIRESEGNLLEADVDVLVNTVNTVGVMGKGIALQFKQAFPDNFKAYRSACQRNEVRLGKMFVVATGRLSPKWIVNFPTKGHWRARSKLSDVEAGLADLRRVLVELGAGSVAVPPLGCGNGGLSWSDVQPRIEHALGDLTHLEVHLYAPKRAPAANEMPVRTERPAMTLGRAALVSLMNSYDKSGFGVSPIELQKLMYFLQVAGEPLQLQYTKARYGPYAENLNHVLVRIEGHFVRGYGDRSGLVRDAAPLTVLRGGVEEASRFLAEHPATQARIRRVTTLSEGFESPYGMELLATIHWLLVDELDLGSDSRIEQLTSALRSWSRRKAGLFTPEHVRLALDHLIERDWLHDIPALSDA
ncbi:MAG TPA: macro domain-containing protein [Nitriliruptorales bacterium]